MTLWFQQVGSTSHKVRVCVAVRNILFPHGAVSHFGGAAAPYSPYLTASEFEDT
jgi:hypothetical protein